MIDVHWTEQTRDFDRVAFTSELVRMGEFRCPVTHPNFEDTGPSQDYCFVFPRRAVWIEHEGAFPFVADATVVPLYNPGCPYRRRAIDTGGDSTDWFAVSPTLLREALATYDRRAAEASVRLFQFGFVRSDASLYLAQRRIFHAVTARAVDDVLAVEESVIGLLADVLATAYTSRSAADIVSDKQRELVEDAKAYLARTFTTNAGLTSVASALDTSVFHLCRLFRRRTGATLHQYRGKLRLRRALGLLIDPRADLLSIALELGYSGHSHFTRAFHRTFGVTPSMFRNQNTRPAEAWGARMFEGIRHG